MSIDPYIPLFVASAEGANDTQNPCKFGPLGNV